MVKYSPYVLPVQCTGKVGAGTYRGGCGSGDGAGGPEWGARGGEIETEGGCLNWR